MQLDKIKGLGDIYFGSKKACYKVSEFAGRS